MECQSFYHVYNHANGPEDLFKEEMNYYFFIDRMKRYLFPVSRIYAYCLMPNHFHLLIETREEKDLELLTGYQNYESPAKYIIKQFSNCFSSYTQSFNKKYKRRGSLFIKSFKHKAITSDNYFHNLMVYIHANPINHGFCNYYEDWKFSSYIDIVEDEKLLVSSHDVLQFFNSKEDFLQFHRLHKSSIDAFEPKLR